MTKKSAKQNTAEHHSWQLDPHESTKKRLMRAAMFIFVGLFISTLGFMGYDRSRSGSGELVALRITVNAKGDTAEEKIQLIIDDEVVETWALTDSLAKYKYQHPYSIGADDVKVAFLNDGQTEGGEQRGVEVEYIKLNDKQFSVASAADYEINDTADDSCDNSSPEPGVIGCAGTFSFNIGTAGHLNTPNNTQRIFIRAYGHTGVEILILKVKDKEVARWNVTKQYKGYSHAYVGQIGSKDIKLEFINDGRTNDVDRNIDIDYIKVNEKKFEGEDKSVYSTATYTKDVGCAPGFKQKARLSCNGYMLFDIGDTGSSSPKKPGFDDIDDPVQPAPEQPPIEEDPSTPPIEEEPVISDPAPETPVTPVQPTPTVPTTPVVQGDLHDLRNTTIVSDFTNVASRGLSIASLTQSKHTPLKSHSSQGQFRTRCQYSHLAYDDPIVHPGKVNGSHLHMFFGNTLTNANTTDSSLLNTGGGSCQGGELNRTAYWIPAPFDGQGRVRIPYDMVVYYKTDNPSKVERMPAGLKMVTQKGTDSVKVALSCAASRDSTTDYNRGNVFPSCNDGDFIKLSIGFPPCWDGRLDSPDHKSHLAHSKKGVCPSSHPRHIPRVTYNMYWKHDGNTEDWYLASDRANGKTAPNGSTLHGDWYGGWNDSVMDLWTNNCTKGGKNCGVGPISDTQKLKSFSKSDRYQGPRFIDDPRLAPSR